MGQLQKGRQYDEFLLESFESIIEKFEINSYVETGFRHAIYIEKLHNKYKHLFVGGAEIDSACCECASGYLGKSSRSILEQSDSVVFLRKHIGGFPSPILFFLDANTEGQGARTPVQEELRCIADVCSKCVVVIHDFKNTRNTNHKGTISSIESISWFLEEKRHTALRFNYNSTYGWANVPVGAAFVWIGFTRKEVDNYQPN
jgi:hypothetical protein